MPLAPVHESNPDVARAFERIQETMGFSEVPAVFRLLANHASLLNDFQMNFRKHVWSDGKLDAKTKVLIAFSVASHKGSAEMVDLLKPRCLELGHSEAVLNDAVAVAATCSMYNTLFKFRDLSGKDYYAGLPVGLRAHTFSSQLLSEQIVELINLVISDLNGCKPCISGHLEKAAQLGMAEEVIYEAIQASATMMQAIAYLQSA